MKTKVKTVHAAAVLAVALSGVLTPSGFAAENVADSEIVYNVKQALCGDARVDASEITVNTDKGVVSLEGSVDNLAAKNYADLEAKKINGVLGVINRIGVLPHFRSDADIANAVRRRILNSAVIESEDIKVASSDGKVTLSGKVGSWAEHDEAALLATEVRGVKEVVNRTVSRYASKRSDQEIHNDVVAKFERDVYLSGLPITVTVKDGKVTLTGAVGSAYEKDRASADARTTSYVKAVENDLKVEWWENHGVRKEKPKVSDDALKMAVETELEVDSRINASDISVKASYGLVTLEGSVYSHYEKSLAEKDAKDVVGVSWVSNKLFARVDEREDWAILDDIDFNLDTDSTTEGFDLDTKVVNGVVTLTGTVHEWYQKSHAGEVASKVKGVRDVINQITVDYQHEAITTQQRHLPSAVVKDVKDNLKSNWTTRWVRDGIQVSVEDGVATLTGKVNTWAQRREAAKVAFNTKGVWSVTNKLEVKDYDYPWSDYYHDSKTPRSRTPLRGWRPIP